MSPSNTQKITDQIQALLGDIDTFNTAAWFGLIGALEAEGVVSGEAFAGWLNLVALECERLRPNHALGKNRLDTAMLRGLAELLAKPIAERRWEPRVIQGGKSETITEKFN